MVAVARVERDASEAASGAQPGAGQATETPDAVTTMPQPSSAQPDTAPPSEPERPLAALEVPDGASGAPGLDTPPPATLPDPGRGTRLPGKAAEDVTAPRPPCDVPPAVTLEVEPAGMTEVIVDSPCHMNEVAELSYDGLRFGIALDRRGAGRVDVIGLQNASDAILRLPDGSTRTFGIPFSDAERIDRVALVWNAPVRLALHAFEFGAAPRSDGHVRPGHPRSFDQVRRKGGGYLTTYRRVDGIGQQIQVYTFWRRFAAPEGVVNLKLDLASTGGAERPDGCGGAGPGPEFKVLRSVAGELERPRHARLAALGCTAVAGTYIGDAVDDLIIRRR